MFKMGKSTKVESNEKEEVSARYSPPASPPPPQQQQAAQVQPLPSPAPSAAHAAPPPARPPAEQPASTSRALSESESIARDIREGLMSGFVGASTVLNGEANFRGMLRVDGRLNGRISSEKGTLIVSAGGHVEADITVATAKINGTVNGDIVASERIEFGRTAKVHGNISTPALVIEQGAVFEGNCRMSALRAVSEKPRQETKPQETRPQETKTRPDRTPVKPSPAAVASSSRNAPASAPVAERTDAIAS